MTPPLIDKQLRTALRRAAVQATYAPSVHNTQPWRLHLGRDELRIYVDRSRRLPVLDPTSRLLTISIGCALFNARVALAASGADLEVLRLPNSKDPELMAVIRPARMTKGQDPALLPLEPVLERRQTNRRRFADDDVPPEVLEQLEEAARAEDGLLHIVRDPEQRLAVARLSQQADNIENLNPAYRAELRAWTTSDPDRSDGVRHLSVPRVDGRSGDEIPIRDFDTGGVGYLPGETHSSREQCLVLLCTTDDRPADWLRAGEALERVLLQVTVLGFAASPLTQVTEVASTRAALRRELGLEAFPHVLVRIGRAAVTPGSRRRRLVDVLTED